MTSGVLQRLEVTVPPPTCPVLEATGIQIQGRPLATTTIITIIITTRPQDERKTVAERRNPPGQPLPQPPLINNAEVVRGAIRPEINIMTPLLTNIQLLPYWPPWPRPRWLWPLWK